MKKILLIIIAAFSFSNVNSQNFALADEFGSVSNGATISVNGTADTIKMGALIRVTNTSGVSKTIKVKKIENGIVSGSSNTFCFAGTCFESSTSVSQNSVPLSVGATDSSFVGYHSPKGHSGTTSIIYVFFDVDNVDDSAWVTINYVALPEGIMEINRTKYEISNPFPNPARNFTAFNYKLSDNVKEAKLVIRDLLGNIVLQEPIYALQGKLTIDISNINTGIYFYSLIINNKAVTSKKIIIQH